MAGLVQIRNVPEDARRALKARAAARGESFNEYLLKLLIEDASRPTPQEVFTRAAERSERATESAVDVIRVDRNASEKGHR